MAELKCIQKQLIWQKAYSKIEKKQRIIIWRNFIIKNIEVFNYKILFSYYFFLFRNYKIYNVSFKS